MSPRSCVKSLRADLSLVQPHQPVLAYPLSLGYRSDYDYHLTIEKTILPAVFTADCNHHFLL